MSDEALIAELRQLLVRCAPDPEKARPALECPPDQDLNAVIPFDSLIVLGFVVGVEHRFGVKVDRQTLARVTAGAPSLARLAETVRALGARA